MTFVPDHCSVTAGHKNMHRKSGSAQEPGLVLSGHQRKIPIVSYAAVTVHRMTMFLKKSWYIQHCVCVHVSGCRYFLFHRTSMLA
jgi:hypothetical protein